MDWINKLIDSIKLSPKYLLPISIATGFIIFAKAEWLQSLGLNDLKARYLPWIGGIFLLSTALSLSHIIIGFYSWSRKRFRMWRAIKNGKVRLHNLTEDERDILKHYVGNGTKTQYLDIQSGVVSEIENNFIIYRSSNIGHLQEWSYNIQPWAWDYLNKHPDLLFCNDEYAALKQFRGLSRRRSA
jgi:hypothetical protein